MEKETYQILKILEDTKRKMKGIYQNAGLESSVNALDFMIIEENLNRIKNSISEIKSYSKGNLKSFSTTSTLRIIANNQFEVLGSSTLIYGGNTNE